MNTMKKSIKGKGPSPSGAGGSKRRASKPLRQVSSGHQSALLAAPAAVSGRSYRAHSRPVEISMREECSDVLIAEAFANSAALINPANADLFPWLATIAEAFTTYYWKKLTFEYVPSSSTALGGTVALVVNANPNSAPFDSVKAAINHEGSATCAPWECIKINALTHSNQSKEPFKLVTDTTGIESIFDELYNIASGVVQIITAVKNIITADDGLAKAVKANLDIKVPDDDTPVLCGKLFVDYTVVLMDPTDETVSDDGIDFYIGTATTGSGVPFPFPETGSAFPGAEEVLPLKTNWLTVTPDYQKALKFTEAGLYQLTCVGNFSEARAVGTDFKAYLSASARGDAQLSQESAGAYTFAPALELVFDNGLQTSTNYQRCSLSFFVLIFNPDTDDVMFTSQTGYNWGGVSAWDTGVSGYIAISKVSSAGVSGLDHSLLHPASCPGLRASGGVISLHHSARLAKAAEILKIQKIDSAKAAAKAVAARQLKAPRIARTSVCSDGKTAMDVKFTEDYVQLSPALAPSALPATRAATGGSTSSGAVVGGGKMNPQTSLSLLSLKKG